MMTLSLDTSRQSILNGGSFSEIRDLGTLLNAIHNDSRLGFSLASFLRQAISLREQWMSDVCVRGRLCASPNHWNRCLFQDPPSAAELPADFDDFFLAGEPWFFNSDTFAP